MRTSASQFDIMVTFMEQHGDLSKPSANARGRITSMQLWDELANILNSDRSGNSKSIEKWKKVWSDFKNNSKKKAARLHRSVRGTGEGPALLTKLSDLEQRVLNLIGMQVATGLAEDEAGLAQQENEILVNILDDSHEVTNSSQPWNLAGTSTRTHIPPPSSGPQNLTSPLITSVEVAMEGSEQNNVEPVPTGSMSTSQRSSSPPAYPEKEEFIIASPVQALTPSGHVAQEQPARNGHTPPQRNQRGRSRRPPRRLIRPGHTELAAQRFLQSDEEWRKFKMEQHRDYMAMRREQNRIRNLELEAQREWRAVGSRALDILEKIVDKFCRD